MPVFFVILFVILAIIVLVLICRNIYMVKQGWNVVVTRLGKYHKTVGPGIHVKCPFIDDFARSQGYMQPYAQNSGQAHTIIHRERGVDMREQILDVPPQKVITKDNVYMEIDAVVFFKVSVPKDYIFAVAEPVTGIKNLTQTTLRNIIGNMSLDETLTSRDNINVQLSTIIDEATDPWGIKILRVEVQGIRPSAEVEEAMQKQMNAEREKRARILEAEGEKQAAITRAEGERDAKVLEAEAEAQAMLKVAQAKAEQIRVLYQAEADGIKALNTTAPDELTMRLRGYQALEKVSEGQAVKLIIPSDLTNLAATGSVLAEGAFWNSGAPKIDLNAGIPTAQSQVQSTASSQSQPQAQPAQGDSYKVDLTRH